MLDALADLICICDEDWLSGPAEVSEDSEDAPSADERRDALELCSRALNALGALASFAPFVQRRDLPPAAFVRMARRMPAHPAH